MSLFTPIHTDKFVLKFNAGDLTEGDTDYPAGATASGCPVSGLAFSDTITESMYDSFQVPERWLVGSDIVVNVHYFNCETQTGVVACNWSLDYQVYEPLDHLDDKVTTNINVSESLPFNTQADTYIKSAMIMAADDTNNPIGKNKFVSFKISRDVSNGSDLLVGEAVLVLLTFEFTMEVL